MIRIAAVGDLHFSEKDSGRYRAAWRDLAGEADVFLLAGDLTLYGTVFQAVALAAELEATRRPIVAVLGNHDGDAGEADGVREALEDIGVHVLEDERLLLRIGGQTLGIAGGKGFGGGFGEADLAGSTDPCFRQALRFTERSAFSLRSNLLQLHADYRVALTHYAPTAATLRGEDPAIHGRLGSALLGEAIDVGGADLAIHGHSHKGTEQGRTAGGVPVRNVALPVIGRPYAVYRLARAGVAEPAA
jgi:Icc-related predicted phosphoesterase